MQKTVHKFLLVKGLFIFLAIITISGKVNANIQDWQKSVTLRLNNQADTEIVNSLNDAVATGADWIAITPGWLTDSKTSNNVYPKVGTPSDAKLNFAIQQAHNRGLKVLLKPHLDIKSGGWRGFLEPSNISTFFANYSAMILKYANVAQAQGVEQLSIGAELVKISTNPSNESKWRNLIASVRAVYGGQLTYSANADYDTYNETLLPFWDALDVLGVSMYRGLSSKDNPTLTDLLNGWAGLDSTFVKPLTEKYNKPFIFTEIGYRSVDFAAEKPWDFGSSGNVDVQIQKDLYTAMFEYWKDKDYFKGLHLWDWKVEPNAGGLSDKDYTPQNKPAEDVLTQYYSSIGGTGGSGNNYTPLIQNITNSSAYQITAANVGATFYTDRTYTLQNLPTYLQGKSLLKTKNADKLINTSNYLQFSLTKDATVFVAFDSRATQLPNWLADWQKAPEQVGTSDTTFNLYWKTFSIGNITLGGNSALPMVGAQSNYFVVATEELFEPSTAIEPPPTPPEPPVEEEPPTPIEPSQITGTVTIEYPDNNATMSGEKKIKIYIDELELNEYTATYEVDNKGQKAMENSSTGGFKQAKIDFDTWTWNGDGPYNVVLRAFDLSGNLIDTANLTLFIK